MPPSGAGNVQRLMALRTLPEFGLVQLATPSIAYSGGLGHLFRRDLGTHSAAPVLSEIGAKRWLAQLINPRNSRTHVLPLSDRRPRQRENARAMRDVVVDRVGDVGQ